MNNMGDKVLLLVENTFYPSVGLLFTSELLRPVFRNRCYDMLPECVDGEWYNVFYVT